MKITLIECLSCEIAYLITNEEEICPICSEKDTLGRDGILLKGYRKEKNKRNFSHHADAMLEIEEQKRRGHGRGYVRKWGEWKK